MAATTEAIALPAAESSAEAAVSPAVTPAKSSYSQILKSSALVGGSQVMNIAIGIGRTKAMAILLGPSGFGLFGLYGSIANLTQSIGGMGINSSGVRQIANAAGSSDTKVIAKTAAVLRRTSVVLGVLGAALLLTFSRVVSKVTFGSTDRTAAICLLSLAVFFNLVSGGQGALIQGMRRISDLAKMNVLGALFGACAAIPLVYFFGQRGVVPSLVSVGGMTILTSWWYSRKINIERTTVSFSEVRQEASALLKLGSAFMASSLLTMGVAYAVRAMIMRTLGFAATGLYQAAWTLGGLYVGFILQAMGADFYPRLTGSINDHPVSNRLVNEQTLVGLLIAGPGVLGTLTFAPLVITLLYSAKFGGAVAILRWICLGATLQVVTWPLGFIIVAKGNQKVFFLAEFAWTVVAIALAWICLKEYGLEGAGIAFFGSYIFHGFLTYWIARWLTGFTWSTDAKKKGLFLLSLIGLIFVAFYFVPIIWAAMLGIAATLVSCVYSARVLVSLVSIDRLPRQIRKLMILLRIADAGQVATT